VRLDRPSGVAAPVRVCTYCVYKLRSSQGPRLTWVPIRDFEAGSKNYVDKASCLSA